MTDEIMLSPQQEKIVAISEGPILVKAGAGSGKTRILTERIRRLLNITKRKILALTFTNKAGDEIAERLKGIENVENRIFVGTFHSFCQSVLESHGHHIGLLHMPHIFDKEADRLELIEEAIKLTPSLCEEYSQSDAKKQRELRYDILSFISMSKRELLTQEELSREPNHENAIFLYNTYQELLTVQNAIDFDDLLLLTYQLFSDYPQVAGLYRRTYEFICIDEAQDLNCAQYGVLKALTNGEHKNVMMVGDSNQSIFAFVGSSSAFMLTNFIHDYSPKVIALNDNFRSSKAVLNVAKQIIPNTCDAKNAIIVGSASLHEFSSETEEAAWVAAKISELIHAKNHPDIEGVIQHEKIAVLARNKYVFEQLETKFDELKIPCYYKMSPGAIELESDLMKMFYLAFKVKLNPLDSLHLKELTAKIKHLKEELDSLEKIMQILTDINHKNILQTVIALSDDGANFKFCLNELKTSLQFDCDNDKKMIYNDIDQFITHWNNYANKTDTKSLLQFRNSMALGKTHPLAQHNGVTLSTVHTMKGQEFEIVFIIGLDNETFPDYRAILAGKAELEQERNNLYVAITRAKRLLYLTWPSQRLMPWGSTKNRSISAFLKNIHI